jgi:hypothetical protein
MTHFACVDCSTLLGGQRYFMKNSLPYCCECYEKVHVEYCTSCGNTIGLEQGQITYEDMHWHATDECFRCYTCSKSLRGGLKFIPKNGVIYCSNNCIKFNTTSSNKPQIPSQPPSIKAASLNRSQQQDISEQSVKIESPTIINRFKTDTLQAALHLSEQQLLQNNNSILNESRCRKPVNLSNLQAPLATMSPLATTPVNVNKNNNTNTRSPQIKHLQTLKNGQQPQPPPLTHFQKQKQLILQQLRDQETSTNNSFDNLEAVDCINFNQNNLTLNLQQQQQQQQHRASPNQQYLYDDQQLKNQKFGLGNDYKLTSILKRNDSNEKMYPISRPIDGNRSTTNPTIGGVNYVNNLNQSSMSMPRKSSANYQQHSRIVDATYSDDCSNVDYTDAYLDQNQRTPMINHRDTLSINNLNCNKPQKRVKFANLTPIQQQQQQRENMSSSVGDLSYSRSSRPQRSHRHHHHQQSYRQDYTDDLTIPSRPQRLYHYDYTDEPLDYPSTRQKSSRHHKSSKDRSHHRHHRSNSSSRSHCHEYNSDVLNHKPHHRQQQHQHSHRHHHNNQPTSRHHRHSRSNSADQRRSSSVSNFNMSYQSGNPSASGIQRHRQHRHSQRSEIIDSNFYRPNNHHHHNDGEFYSDNDYYDGSGIYYEDEDDCNTCSTCSSSNNSTLNTLSDNSSSSSSSTTESSDDSEDDFGGDPLRNYSSHSARFYGQASNVSLPLAAPRNQIAMREFKRNVMSGTCGSDYANIMNNNENIRRKLSGTKISYVDSLPLARTNPVESNSKSGKMKKTIGKKLLKSDNCNIS